MRIVIAFILFIIASSADLKSQGILLPNQTRDSTKHQDKTFIVIKGDEIGRFPSANFMDAVNGLFPWIFTPYSSANDFIFVVNGFLLADINSFSINDIEEIVFTRNNLYGNQFPFSKAGTFFIKTKRTQNNKTEVNFNSQYNHVWNKEHYVAPNKFHSASNPNNTSNISNNKPGYYISNHISLSTHGKKMSLLFSAQINLHKFPELHQTTNVENLPYRDTIQATTVVKHPEQRLFLNFTYKFSDKVDAGITAAYSYSRLTQDTTYRIFYTGGVSDVAISSKSPLTYYQAGAFINYKPLKNLSNTLWFEYAYDTMATKYQRSNKYANTLGQPMHFIENTNINAESKRYVIRDELKYNFIQTKKFSAEASLTFIYLQQYVTKDRNTSTTVNGTYYGASGSAYWGKQKIATLNPVLNMAFEKIIFGHIGLNRLIGKELVKNVEKQDKTSLFGGLTIDFSELMKLKKTFSDLSLSFNYAYLHINHSNNQWLGSSYDAYLTSPQHVLSATLKTSNPFRLSILKNRLTAIHLNAVSLNNRFQFIAEWSQLKTEKLYPLTIGGMPNFLFYGPGIETLEGLSFAFSGKLLDNQKIKLRTGLNILFPKTKLEQIGINSGELIDSSAFYAGFQSRIDYKNFFFQANILADINHAYYMDQYPSWFRPEAERHNDFTINYLLLGYNANLKNKSAFKSISIFLQARNPFVSKKLREIYQFDHYGGIGVNLRF
jgi:hypothetical protein